MRLIVGLTKKIGLPGFGSVGATCQLESGEFTTELASDEFDRRVKRAFDACRKAVEQELATHDGSSFRTPDFAEVQDRRSSNGSAFHGDQSRPGRPPGDGCRPATSKQLNALRTMASRSRLSREELDELFRGKPLDALTIAEASAAIDRLKGGAATYSNGATRNGSTKGGS